VGAEQTGNISPVRKTEAVGRSEGGREEGIAGSREAHYCREIEAYLCRKNDGHLIRIVGPSFERVCGWAAQGVPLRVVYQGIDRYFERYYARGPRRRPVQIDFCENDVLDAFEAWRRAIGVRMPGGDAGPEASQGRRGRRSLPEHLDRVCERAADRRASLTPLSPELDEMLEIVAKEAAAFRDLPGPIRGDTRERVAARLNELDRLLLDAARASGDSTVLESMRAEAAEQLLPFRDRLPSDAYDRALESAVDRLLRERERLPTVGYE
jgi:hypothetical protein